MAEPVLHAKCHAHAVRRIAAEDPRIQTVSQTALGPPGMIIADEIRVSDVCFQGIRSDCF